jgi:hypothetical protein
MTLALKPSRGGFLRPFGCGWFIREFLMGHGPYSSKKIDPRVGAPQADICYQYKTALINTVASDRATREEERLARRENRAIDPDRIEKLAAKHRSQIPYKSTSCRFHSFVVYFTLMQRLGWVEETGREEPSAFQEQYPPGPPRRYFRLTKAGILASDYAWANPRRALYGQQ